MEEPLKLLLAQMKAKKFQHEDEGIHVHLFADGVITKLIKVLICLAIGIEVIDKLNPSVKCFPIGRTFKAQGARSDAAKYIRDYNYQQFLNVYCETAIADYSNYRGYQAWKKTCPSPAGTGTTQCNNTDLEMKTDPGVQNCTREGPESILAILRSKKTSIRDLIQYLIISITKTDKIYDCRPRTLYYYYMSWTILIYALILGLGPTLWNVLYGRKIVDRTRHIKDFIDTIVDEDEDKKKEMINTLSRQVKSWNSSEMMIVAVMKTLFALVVTLLFIVLFLRGFRADIENLAFTVCKVHDYEYAKCASARVGLIQFVWLFCMVVMGLIGLLCLTNLRSLFFPGDREKMFLVNLLKKQLSIDVFQSRCCMCCSDLILMSVLCERNRNLFGRAWRRFNRKMSIRAKWGLTNKKAHLDSVLDNRESAL